MVLYFPNSVRFLGGLLRIPNLKPTSLERLLNGTSKPFIKPDDMHDAEVPIFIDFVRGMLQINPDTRKSAAELLQHEWISITPPKEE